jgi:hypothetical protein
MQDNMSGMSDMSARDLVCIYSNSMQLCYVFWFIMTCISKQFRRLSGDWVLGRPGRQIGLDSVGLRVSNFFAF